MTLKRVYIEVINRCNLSCSFCPPTKRAARTMSVAEFDRLAAQVAPLCSYIYLHIKGEPLLHPQFEELMQSAHRHRLLVNLTTNGVLLPHYADILAASPALRQTNISLHGYTPKSHGELECWLEKLCVYAQTLSERERYTVFRFWTLDDGRKPTGYEPQMLEYLQRRFSYDGSLADAAGNRSAALAKGIFVSFDRQFEWPSPDNPDYGEHGRCHGARSMLGILADGTVVPCCLDGEGYCPLGNAFEQPLAELLHSQELLRIAEGFDRQDVTDPLCRRCGYRLRFSRRKTKNIF